MSRSREGSIRVLVLALFFLSGACGLVYEVVWMRMLTLVFGATAFATSTVLASFFAGLALGSFLFGRVVDRGRNPLALYALLEAGVGISAIAMPWLLGGVTDAYVHIARLTGMGFYQLSLVRFALSFLVLLVPATLMGGTLPVIVKFFVRKEERVGWHVGQLYAINTFGAVVGTMGTGFFLILLLGLRESAYLAAAVNLVVAGVVFAVSRRIDVGVGDAAPAADPAPGEAAGAAPSEGRLARLALWAVGISGLCALALEVLWTRALVFFLDNSTHAFTTMLTAFLLGIALGSAAIARFLDRRMHRLALLGVIEILIGLSAILAIPILGRATPVLETMIGVTPDSMIFWKWSGLRFVMSLTVMLVPTVLMGMTVPLVTKMCTSRLSLLGTALGRVYSVNTIGGVLGSLVAGFVLIPLMGVQNGIVVVAGVSVLLGGALVLWDPWLADRPGVRVSSALALVLACAGTFHFASGSMTLSSYRESVDSSLVLSYDEGIGSTVKVFQDARGDKYVSIDGFPVAGSSFGLQDAQKSLGNLPLLLTDATAARVNLIGFGAGGASWAVTQYDVSQVDCVELVPGVIEAARWFPDVNHGVLDDPRYNLIMGDGRNHALISDETYDIISIDATSPKMAGNGSLYTLEFYELLKDRVSEDGMVVQWLPFHLLSDREMRMTAKTFMEVFPHTTVWFSPIRHHGLLVGTQEKLRIDFGALTEKMARENIREELALFHVRSAVDVLSWFVMGEEGLRNYVGDARINTDNHPYLEFTPAMAYFYTMQYATQNLLNLARGRESVFRYLVNVGGSQEEVDTVELAVERRFLATQHSISGDILYYVGEEERARGEYRAALFVDPTDKNWMHPIWRDFRPQR